MSKFERLESECPPDAHKVFREPENQLKAQLCVKVNTDEIERYGIADVLEVLSLMSEKPHLMCDAATAELIKAHAAEAEIKPSFVQQDGQEAYILYTDGARGPHLPFYDLAGDYHNFKDYLSLLSQECLISVDMLSMLILRSISTVYPWDKLLAGDFVRQYLKASEALTPADRELLTDIRYVRKSSDIKKTEERAYQFLRLERKLFLQYPSEDD